MKKHLIRSAAFVFLTVTALLLTSGSETEDETSLQIQYHQMRVQMAELEYDQAAESNRRVPGSFGERHLERLQKNVRLAQTLLESAKHNDGKDMSTMHVVHAELWATIAASDYRAALEVRRRSPDAMSKYRVKKARLAAEIAELRVEMWKEPKTISSLVDHMHWEIDRMSRDILDLQQRLERLE